jgi:subtilisin family serine protease
VSFILRLAKSIEDGVNIGIVSISPGPGVPDPGDPANRAIQASFYRGIVIVVAAGNYGPSIDSLSRWCTPYSICVGAANSEGTNVFDFSSRGKLGKRSPTVVAPAVRTRPDAKETASELRSKKDNLLKEGNPTPLDLAENTTITGSSVAAAEVTAIVGVLYEYLENEIIAGRLQRRTTFKVEYDLLPGTANGVRNAKRYVGTEHIQNGKRVVTYPLKWSPELAKQILRDLAVTMEGYDEAAAGAGFVSFGRAIKIFGKYKGAT